MVVGLTPRLNHYLSLGKRNERLTRKAFVSEATLEALHVGVLPGTAWFDVRGANIDQSQELTHSLANELRSVITANELWPAADREQINQQSDEIVTGELSIDLQSNTLACKFVDQRKTLQRTAFRGSTENEVD